MCILIGSICCVVVYMGKVAEFVLRINIVVSDLMRNRADHSIKWKCIILKKINITGLCSRKCLSKVLFICRIEFVFKEINTQQFIHYFNIPIVFELAFIATERVKDVRRVDPKL